MSPVEWFYAQGDKQQGPVSAAEVKALADSGRLKPDDLVWREGMDEWIPARRVKGLFDAEPPAGAAATPAAAPGVAAPSPAPAAPRGAQPAAPPVFEKSPAAYARAREGQARHLFDFVLEFARGQFTGHFIEATSRMFAVCGHYGLYLAMAVMLGFSLMLGAKANELNPILAGLGAVALLAVLQYAAGRFVAVLDKLNRATTGKLASPALPDSVAVLLGLGGVVMLLALAVQAIQTERFLLILPAIAAFILCEFMAIVALNPDSLQLTVTSETPPGEEALGVVSFGIKLLIRTAPVAFGVGVVRGTIVLLYATFAIFSPPKGDPGIDALLPPGSAWFATGKIELLPASLVGSEAATTLLFWAAVPLAAYVLFLCYQLVIDVLRAVLAVPSKLDRLRGEEEKEEE